MTERRGTLQDKKRQESQRRDAHGWRGEKTGAEMTTSSSACGAALRRERQRPYNTAAYMSRPAPRCHHTHSSTEPGGNIFRCLLPTLNDESSLSVLPHVLHTLAAASQFPPPQTQPHLPSVLTSLFLRRCGDGADVASGGERLRRSRGEESRSGNGRRGEGRESKRAREIDG